MKSNLKNDWGLDPETMPAHVAVIMDGNGRWARQKLMNRVKGHEQGTRIVREIVTAASEIGIQVLTLYAFSTENWARPKTEVKALMMLLKKFVISERETMVANRIRMNVIGQKYRLPDDVRKEVDKTVEMTRLHDGLILNLALSYGGREEMTTAVQAIARQIEDKKLKADEINSDLISEYLYTRGMPDPDLIIRTSGEYRLSNFLLWQAAYAELFFINTLWPDFSKTAFINILKDFQQRDRRFGKVECSTSNDG